MSYNSVNRLWPEGTNDGRNIQPTPQEAISAARRLYRFVFKRPFKGKIELTSGNRYSQIRNGVMYVNPNWNRGGMHQGGWHELVHLLSHDFFHRKYPGKPGHGSLHAELEYEMTEYVVRSGWLDGKLKRPEKPKPSPVQMLSSEQEKIDARIKRWETKKRRAETALRKLRQKVARLERRLAA